MAVRCNLVGALFGVVFALAVFLCPRCAWAELMTTRFHLLAPAIEAPLLPPSVSPYESLTGAMSLFDCFKLPVSRLSFAVSGLIWRSLGFQSQMHLGPSVRLDLNCGLLIGERVKSLLSKETVAAAVLTFLIN